MTSTSAERREDGVLLDGNTSGDIRNVVSNFNGLDGFAVNTFTGGTISDNTASGNDGLGFLVLTFTDGMISGNTASGNTDDGFWVNTFNGGNSAVFSNNSSTNNTLQGYNFITGTPSDGSMTNTGSGNGGGTDNF